MSPIIISSRRTASNLPRSTRPNIPLPTTTITVSRISGPGVDDDPTEFVATMYTVTSGIPAHLSSPSGSEQRDVGSSQEQVQYKLIADPCDLRHNDTVLDEKTGVSYQVTWARERPGVDAKFDYMEAQVYIVSGQI